MADKVVEAVLYIAFGFLVGFIVNDIYPIPCATDMECMELRGGDGSPE